MTGAEDSIRLEQSISFHCTKILIAISQIMKITDVMVQKIYVKETN